MANDQNPLAQFGVVATPASPSPVNPLATLGVPAQKTQIGVQPTEQPSPTADYLSGTVYPRVLGGANDFVQGVTAVPKEMMAPPSTPTEALLHFVSPGGLPAYRLARNLIQAAERVKTASASEYQQAVDDYNKTVQQFRQHDWRNAIPSAVETASDVASVTNPMMAIGNSNVHDLAEGTRKGGNLAGPLTKDALTAGLAAAPELAEGDALATPTLSKMRVNPFRSAAKTPTVDVPASAAVRGANAIQPAVHRIAGEAADAAAVNAGTPVASRAGGIRTYLDEPIANVAERERATYDKLNAAATSDPDNPVDLKKLYDQREQVIDRLDDPDAILSRKEDAIEMARLNMQIDRAEQVARANGVAPESLKNAIADTRTRYSMQDLKKKLFDSESVVKGNIANGAPETLDVNKAIDAVEKLDKEGKYAPAGGPTRLEQALGKDGAKALKDNLYAAKKAGQRAVNYNRVAKWLGASIGAAALGTGVVEGVRAATGS